MYIAKTFKNLLLVNHWFECIDVWHGASLGPGDSIYSNEVPGVINGPDLGA